MRVGYLASRRVLEEQINTLANTYVKPTDAASGEAEEDDVTRAKCWARDHLSRHVSIDSGVRCLQLVPVWVAQGVTMECWMFPLDCSASQRSDKDTGALHKLLKIIRGDDGITFEEPKTFTRCDYLAPLNLGKEIYGSFIPFRECFSFERIGHLW